MSPGRRICGAEFRKTKFFLLIIYQRRLLVKFTLNTFLFKCQLLFYFQNSTFRLPKELFQHINEYIHIQRFCNMGIHSIL